MTHFSFSHVGLQQLLLVFHASSGGDEAPSEALLFERFFMDDVVLHAEALVFLGLRHVIVIDPFKEVVGI